MGNKFVGTDNLVEVEIRKYVEINLDDVIEVAEDYVLETLLDELEEDVCLPDVSEKYSDAVNSIMKALGRKIIEKYDKDFEF